MLRIERMTAIDAATTIALSAKLNTGQFGSWIQSITCPVKNPGARKIRSERLPRIPPKASPRTIDQPKEVIFIE
jgi:hypothetical protein